MQLPCSIRVRQNATAESPSPQNTFSPHPKQLELGLLACSTLGTPSSVRPTPEPYIHMITHVYRSLINAYGSCRRAPAHKHPPSRVSSSYVMGLRFLLAQQLTSIYAMHAASCREWTVFCIATVLSPSVYPLTPEPYPYEP